MESLTSRYTEVYYSAVARTAAWDATPAEGLVKGLQGEHGSTFISNLDGNKVGQTEGLGQNFDFDMASSGRTLGIRQPYVHGIEVMAGSRGALAVELHPCGARDLHALMSTGLAAHWYMRSEV